MEKAVSILWRQAGLHKQCVKAIPKSKAQWCLNIWSSSKSGHQTRSSLSKLPWSWSCARTANNRIMGLVSNNHTPWNESIETKNRKGWEVSSETCILKLQHTSLYKVYLHHYQAGIIGKGERQWRDWLPSLSIKF